MPLVEHFLINHLSSSSPMDKSSLITVPLSSSYKSKIRLSFNEDDIRSLRRSDLVSFVMINAIKTRINCVEFVDGRRLDKMFYVVSEFIATTDKKKVPLNARFMFKDATLNIEWQSILSVLEAGDELELLWCQDWEELPYLDLFYDCVRFVIFKSDDKQLHFRLHTFIGDSETRLLKSV